jgi:hypothetical protein
MSALVDRIVSEQPHFGDALTGVTFDRTIRAIAVSLVRANVAPSWIPYFTYEGVSTYLYEVAKDINPAEYPGDWREREKSRRYSDVAYRFHEKAMAVKPRDEFSVAA